MASSEEKTELVDAIKGPRYYRIRLYGYGGEGAYVNISKEAYDFWNKHTDDFGDNDFITYMVNDDPEDCDFEELQDVPQGADFLRVEDGEYKNQWYEAENEFCHQNGVTYNTASIEVEELDSDDYNADIVATLIDGEDVGAINDRVFEESEIEITNWSDSSVNDPELIGGYVAEMYSSEKGCFFEGRLEITGNFDVKQLKININEYPNGDDIVEGIEYAGVEVDNDGGDTTGKGYSAHVWKNVQ